MGRIFLYITSVANALVGDIYGFQGRYLEGTFHIALATLLWTLTLKAGHDE